MTYPIEFHFKITLTFYDITVPLAPLQQNTVERIGLPPPGTILHLVNCEPPPAPSADQTFLHEAEKKGLPLKYSVLHKDELAWDPRFTVEETLSYYAENGDVQTAVVMALVLGDRISIEKKRLRQWFLSYIG